MSFPQNQPPFATPSLMTLTARRASQIPFGQFRRLPESAQEEVYQEVCRPQILWHFEPNDNPDDDVHTLLTLFSMIRGHVIWFYETRIFPDDMDAWWNLLHLIQGNGPFNQTIGDFNFYRFPQDVDITLEITGQQLYTTSGAFISPVSGVLLIEAILNELNRINIVID